MTHEEDFGYSDYYVVLVSNGLASFEDVAQEHPDIRFVIVGAKNRSTLGNAHSVSDLIELQSFFRKLTKQEEQLWKPVKVQKAGSESKRKRRSRTKIPCSVCGKGISALGLALRSHEESCKKELAKREARGKVITLLQPNGRSRGSLLIVSVPEDTTVGATFLSKGVHLIDDPRLIKRVNSEFSSRYRYHVEREVLQ